MKALRERAQELRAEGRTALQAYRVLRVEFRSAERDQLVDAVQLPGARTGYQPFWAQTGGFLLSPVTTKYPVKPESGAPR